jgi:hypothetical protein
LTLGLGGIDFFANEIEEGVPFPLRAFGGDVARGGDVDRMSVGLNERIEADEAIRWKGLSDTVNPSSLFFKV